MQTESQDIAAIFASKLKAMRDQTREFESEWNNSAATVPQIKGCEFHNYIRPLDRHSSIIKSWRDKKFCVIYRPCPKCAADELLRTRSTYLIKSGVPEILAHASFDNFLCRTEDDSKNLELAREFARLDKGFIVMRGDVGTGKSHLSVAIARATERKVRFVTQVNLLKRLRDTYRDRNAEDIIESCRRVHLLILDEVGLSGGGKDELPMLHEILGERHNTRKPTVLTTNLTRPELEETLGERLTDRLSQSGFRLLNFSGESMRRQMRSDY